MVSQILQKNERKRFDLMYHSSIKSNFFIFSLVFLEKLGKQKLLSRLSDLQQFRPKKSPAYTELTTYLLLSSPGNFSNVLLQRCYSRLKDTLPQMTRAVGSTLKLGGRPRLIPQKTSRNNVRFRFLTPLLTHFVREFLTYNVCFFRVILAPVPIIKSDVINGRSSILGWVWQILREELIYSSIRILCF